MGTVKETGAEELRRVVRACNLTREDALSGFSAEQVLRLMRACWASPWDILPDALTEDERAAAAARGTLSPECVARLERDLG